VQSERIATFASARLAREIENEKKIFLGPKKF